MEGGNLARTLSQPRRSKKLHGLVSRRDTRAIVADIAYKGGSRRPRNAFFAFCRHSVRMKRSEGRDSEYKCPELTQAPGEQAG